MVAFRPIRYDMLDQIQAVADGCFLRPGLPIQAHRDVRAVPLADDIVVDGAGLGARSGEPCEPIHAAE